MGEVLFLSHRIPFPPDRGDKIRSHHVLKALACLAPVHVATFADDPADLVHEGELAQLAASHCLVERRKPVPVAALEALACGEPVSLRAFRDARISSYVTRVISERPISAVYVFSGQMAQYVPAAFQGRVVADLVDVDSAKFQAYAAAGKGPRAWMEAREARLLAQVEQAIVERAETTLLVSEEEAGLLRGRLRQSALRAKVLAMGNGIDTAAFDPVTTHADPAMSSYPGPRIVFTGQMDYPPNIAAVMRTASEIMPRLRRHLPDASFHVVGRNPSEALRKLDGRDGVRIWGRVPDVRPYLAAADLALVPLDIARGVQNKVLEAMAMALPTVLTSGAATGIPAQDGRDFLIRDSDEALAEAVLELIAAPQRLRSMGEAARNWVTAHASWPAALADLPRYCGIAPDGR